MPETLQRWLKGLTRRFAAVTPSAEPVAPPLRPPGEFELLLLEHRVLCRRYAALQRRCTDPAPPGSGHEP